MYTYHMFIYVQYIYIYVYIYMFFHTCKGFIVISSVENLHEHVCIRLYYIQFIHMLYSTYLICIRREMWKLS